MKQALAPLRYLVVLGKPLAELLNWRPDWRPVRRNAKRCAAVRQRVQDLVERCIELQRLQNPAGTWSKETATLKNEIDQMLGRYRFRRQLPWANTQSLFEPEIRSTRKTDSTEVFVVDIVLRLLEKNALDRLRRCQVCQRWFMAVRAHERNCSKTCRDRCGVRSNKEKWNAYHRNRREMRKIKGQLKVLNKARPSKERKDEIVQLNAKYKVLLKEQAKLRK
jgi:hypothetical protein